MLCWVAVRQVKAVKVCSGEFRYGDVRSAEAVWVRLAEIWQAKSQKFKGGKQMSAYQWKSGSRIKADAQKSGELFERLSNTEEGLTARTLLDANRPKNAPLHNEYEWNDETAADNWRLHQSRHFINSIAIIATTSEDVETPVRAFHITTSESKYEPITAIIKEPDKYAALLKSAKAELMSFKNKYNTLRELTPVLKAIEEVTNE
jgi:hypothetical protein